MIPAGRCDFGFFFFRGKLNFIHSEYSLVQEYHGELGGTEVGSSETVCWVRPNYAGHKVQIRHEAHTLRLVRFSLPRP